MISGFLLVSFNPKCSTSGCSVYGSNPFLQASLAFAQAISSACGEALGELAASVRGTSAQNALQQEMRVSRRTTLDKVLSQGLQRCIVRPFVEAAVFSKKVGCDGHLATTFIIPCIYISLPTLDHAT